jgi:hypothetical protein
MMPTKANSAHTRSNGRCLVTRLASSFSLCSGLRALSATRDGGPKAVDRVATSGGVNDFGKRRCKAETTYRNS